MTTRTSHPAFISLQGGINFRDLGGQRAADGRRVRSGKLLRSGSLHNMTPEDLNHLSAIPLSRVLDYRDPTEVNRSPDRLNSEAFTSTPRPIRFPAASMRKSPSLTPRPSTPWTASSLCYSSTASYRLITPPIAS